nr:hypothetical protein [Nanoarchaeum sp.]
MVSAQIRQTAYKIWISDLVNGEFINPEGEWDPSYVKVKNLNVSRVNIIANAIDKYKNEDSNHISLTLDDGSDNISLKTWNEDSKLLNNVEIGDMILVIARVKEYNNKIYLTPEIVRKLDKPEWMILRKKELVSEYGERKQVINSEHEIEQEFQDDMLPKITEESIFEEEPSNALRQKLLNTIEKNDKGDGADLAKVIFESKIKETKAQNLIYDLLKEGEIFEIKTGRVKLIQ